MTRFHIRSNALVLAVLLLLGSGVQAQRNPETIPGGPSKGNSRLLDAFKPAVAKVADSTVAILLDGKQVALGTIVQADGYVLTKNSELRPGKITVKFKDGKEVDARKISNNDIWDLAMLKVDASKLQPVTWGDSKEALVGTWVITPGPADRPVSYGVVGVATRRMPPVSPLTLLPRDRGFMGVQLEDSEGGDGAKIVRVTPMSPAAKAGLKADDIVTSVDDKPTPTAEALIRTVAQKKPNDKVTLTYLRGGEEIEVTVTLAKFPENGGGGFDRGDFQNAMGTERSERRTGFPVTLQHDATLKATQCGGPLVDLDGRVIGINIARGGRTDTYALPAESIKPLLPDLIAAKVPASALADLIKAAEASLKEAEAQKTQAEKKVAEAKAALEKLLAEQKKEKEKK
jgi:serine protease Do